MTQKTVNSSSKGFCRNVMLIEDHAPAVYAGRPILYSVKNTERLATESSRARRIFLNKTEEKCSRDFAAYFRSSPKSIDPNYVASHTFPEFGTRQNVVPTFAMTQSLRWNPYVETSSIEDVSHTERDPHNNCRCANCSTKNCPSRMSSSNAFRSSSNRNNIMTFADIYTMTPKLIDAACGSSIVPSTRVSEASVSNSDIAVRDTRASMHFVQLSNSPRTQPIPILKTTRRCDYNDVHTVVSNCNDYDRSRRDQEPERDVYDPELSRVSSIRSFFTRKKKKERSSSPSKNRRIIYNEGINDATTERCPATAMRVTSEADEWRGSGSRVCMRHRNHLPLYDDEEEQIPHSQMYSSRYHKNCKPKNEIFYYDNDEVCYIIPPPPKLKPRKAECRKHFSPTASPCIKLPKKVLTSDANIEHYDPRCYHRFTGAVCNRWKSHAY